MGCDYSPVAGEDSLFGSLQAAKIEKLSIVYAFKCSESTTGLHCVKSPRLHKKPKPLAESGSEEVEGVA